MEPQQLYGVRKWYHHGGNYIPFPLRCRCNSDWTLCASQTNHCWNLLACMHRWQYRESTVKSNTRPVVTSMTQPLPYSDLCPLVIHDPSKLTQVKDTPDQRLGRPCTLTLLTVIWYASCSSLLSSTGKHRRHLNCPKAQTRVNDGRIFATLQSCETAIFPLFFEQNVIIPVNHSTKY